MMIFAPADRYSGSLQFNYETEATIIRNVRFDTKTKGII